MTFPTATTQVLPPRVSQIPVKRLTMSYDEYLAIEHGNRLIEWVNGEVVYHMSAKDMGVFHFTWRLSE
ncbi:MAG: hypothetical protein ACE5GO_06110, partial [Anaerolineales bacterium]